MSVAKAIDGERETPRRRPRGLKVDLFKWVEDQQQLDMRTKYILEKLASFAQADCTSWSPIGTLAYAANCSDRTVQYHLRALEDAGLIRPTGRLQRLENSSRSVPIYQLAPGVEGLGAPLSNLGGMGARIAPIDASSPSGADPMGAEIAPIAGAASVQFSRPMGATGLHPVNETQETLSGAKAPSPGAHEAAFAELEGVAPKGLLKYSDRDAAAQAFDQLLDQGVEPGRVIAAARRMAADPAFRTKKFPPPLHDWLAKGQWRGWDGEDAPTVKGATERPRFAGPPEIRAAFVAEVGEDSTGSWLDPCGYEPGPPARLVARTGVARDWLLRQRRVLQQFDLVVEVQGQASKGMS